VKNVPENVTKSWGRLAWALKGRKIDAKLGEAI
jgi:hypothetical protein